MIWRLLNVDCRWEPIELRMLKKNLASIACKCESCEKYRTSKNHLPENLYKDQEVQVEQDGEPDAEARVEKWTSTADHYFFPDDKCPFRRDLLCPNCYMTMNILRGGIIKVVKDEECETKAGMFTRDKASENTVEYLEKTTSLTAKPVLKYRNLVYCDTISELTCSDSLTSTPNPSPHREVTFAFSNDYYSDVDVPYEAQQQSLSPSPESEDTENDLGDSPPENDVPPEKLPSRDFGVCIDSYIDSIRPPWSEISPTGHW